MKYLMNLTLLCGLMATVTAQSIHFDTDYYSAYSQYQAAADGDSRATRRAVDQFTRLHQANPNDPVALVLLGSSQTLQGRDAWMPWNKMNYTETGLDSMNQALRLVSPGHSTQTFDDLPVSIMVPLFAALTFVQVPDFFGRFEQGYSLLLDISRHPDLNAVPEEARTMIHYYTAWAATRVNEHEVAEQALSNLFALALDDEYTQLAQQNLRSAP